jgi:type I restriction enzyme S subunit
MNAALLLEHYKRIADAPDAIAQLREFVLVLAMQGKATSFNGPWRNATLGDLGAWGSGGTPSKSRPEFYGGGIPWLVIGDLNDGVVERSQASITEAGLANSSAKLISPGTVLIAMYGSIGKLGFAGIECATNQAIAYCVPAEGIVTRQFLFWLLRSLRKELLGRGQGIAQQNISQKILKAWPVQVPPLPEQRRIVAKIDELMALCDQLEAAQAEREGQRDKLTLSTLAKLNEPDPVTFAADARFALEHLEPLTKRTDQIRRLRQTILNLAVRGKLVEQDADDEAAAAQIRSISQEREELVRAKSIRREKPLKPVHEDEPPFEIPLGWLWSKIGEVALFTQYGTSEKAHPIDRGVPVLTMGNIQNGEVRWGYEKRIPETSDELPSLYLRRFDLLYNRTNSAELVGKTGIYLGDDDCRTFASYLIRIRCSQKYSLPAYVNLAMNAPVFRDTQIAPLIKQQTGQANVNGTALKNMLIPLPPLAEQHRIVAKVDELMALCDQLEASMAQGEQTRSKLLEAVLHEALADQ